MIVICPGCGKRYRLGEDRLGAARRRLRCAACGRVFEASAAAAPGAAASPGVRQGERVGQAAAGRPLVLVADEVREFRDLVRHTLESLGCEVQTTDDGEAAFRFAVARKPRALILNVYLRRLLGVAVCEGVKGSPDLRGTRVALIGSVFKSDRFVRGPGHLYGADDYFEDVIPEAELRQRLARLLEPGGAPPRRRSAGAASDAGEAAAPPQAAAPVGAGGATHEQIDPRAEIRRLARIMLSDLKIYHPDTFLSAIVERRFFETFREELTNGKDLIIKRFPNLPDRLEVLATALREGMEKERQAAGAGMGAGA